MGRAHKSGGFDSRRIQFNPGIVSWLLDHLIRSHQHVGRNRQADLLGGLQIDHKLELRRLLNGKIRGLGAFKDFVDVEGSATFADLDVPKRRAA
jgi:hypothetical protein